MRLERVKIRNLGPFRDAEIDFTSLGDAMLVAVCGDNGEGKSTLLELAIPGAFYRTMPTQGSLRDRATARDSLLEVVVSGARDYTIRHLIDGVSGKGESVVLDAAGKPVSGSTKVSEFALWSSRHLPDQEVLLASTFGAQQDRGFLGASPSDRKAILLRALGIERYEIWATRAGDRARACKQALELTRARLDEARRTAGNVAELNASFELAKQEAARLDAELARARAALAELEEQARAAEAAATAHASHVAKQVELRARVQTLGAKRDELDTRIAACNRTLSQESAIRDAASKLEQVRQQMTELDQERAAARSRLEAARERAQVARTQADQARRHHARVSARIGELEAVLARSAEIAKAEVDSRDIEQGLVVLRQGVRDAQTKLDELTAATVAGAEERVLALRGGLEEVQRMRDLDGAHAVAQGCLRHDDAAVQQAAERPAKLREARKAVEDLRALVTKSEARYQQLSALARRAGEITAAKEQLASLWAELAQHAEAIETHGKQAEQAAAQVRALEADKTLGERHRSLNEQADRLRPLAEQLPNIALAASKLEERTAQRGEVVTDLDAAERALADLGPAPPPVAHPDVAPQRAQVDGLEGRARSAHQGVAVASSKLEAARAMEDKLRALEAQQRGEETELADWARLAEDLGRKGLQAAEIDGCGPELTTLVNDLLHAAHGPRFTVRIDTQKLSADGKKTLEGCQVTVIDTVRGREDEGSRFSGGERVIIGEALALGLSMLACQRSGLRGVTLVRDETGAALDPGNAEVYVKMLRRAAEQVGADRVLFVCHNPEVSELADARITVSGGRLVVDAPARRVAA